MIIDIIFLVFLALGFYLGFSRGLISSLFSFIALFLGAAIAVKWSHNTALYLSQWTGSHSPALPVISFVLLFIIVIILVHLLSKLLESIFSTVGLGFLNKFAGAFLWCLILTFVLSIMLWFANQLHWIGPQTRAASTTYNYIEPIAPAIIDGFSKVIPWFKNEFEHLEDLLSRHTPGEPGK